MFDRVIRFLPIPSSRFKRNLKNFEFFRSVMRRISLFFALILFASISSAEVGDGTCSNGCVSISDYNNISTELTEKNRKIENLTNRIEELNESKREYQKLYRKYQELYLSEDANVTNRELVRVQENLTFVRKDLRDYSKEVENVEKNINNLNFKIKLALSLLSIAIIDIAVRFFLALKGRKREAEGN